MWRLIQKIFTKCYWAFASFLKVSALKAILSYECKWPYNYACTVKPHDTELKNALVKSVCYVTKYTIPIHVNFLSVNTNMAAVSIKVAWLRVIMYYCGNVVLRRFWTYYSCYVFRKSPGSNFGPHAGCPDWGFPRSPLFDNVNAEIVTQMRPRTLSSTSFLYHNTIIQRSRLQSQILAPS